MSDSKRAHDAMLAFVRPHRGLRVVFSSGKYADWLTIIPDSGVIERNAAENIVQNALSFSDWWPTLSEVAFDGSLTIRRLDFTRTRHNGS